MDRRPALGIGVGERQPGDLLRAFAGDQLQALGHVGRLHMLDAGIQILDVFAHHHQVDAAPGIGRPHTGTFLDRPDVAVQLEHLTQGHVGAFLAIADRRGQRTLQNHAHIGDHVQRVARQAAGDALVEGDRAGLGIGPVQPRAGRVQHLQRRFGNLRPDTVAGDDDDRWRGPLQVHLALVGTRHRPLADQSIGAQDVIIHAVAPRVSVYRKMSAWINNARAEDGKDNRY